MIECRFEEACFEELLFFHQLDFLGFLTSGIVGVGGGAENTLVLSSVWPGLEFSDTRDRNFRIEVGRGGSVVGIGGFSSAVARGCADDGGDGVDKAAASMSSADTCGRFVPAVRLSNLGSSSCSEGMVVEVPMMA
jgi:hypothetical protein